MVMFGKSDNNFGSPLPQCILGRRATGNGPISVKVRDENDISKWVVEHRLMWETFKGPISKGWKVCHIDGNLQNNNIINLVAMPHRDVLRLFHGARKVNDKWEKTCPSCGKVKPLSGFKEMHKRLGKMTETTTKYCTPCHKDYALRYVKANLSKTLEVRRKWWETNKEKMKEWQLAYCKKNKKELARKKKIYTSTPEFKANRSKVRAKRRARLKAMQ